MDRKEYWNKNYLEYFRKKIKEANSSGGLIVNKNDVKTASDNLIFEVIESIKIGENYNVLDFGCGFCRIYPYFKNKKVKYKGIDISEAMIKESLELYPELNGNLFVSEGENLPFDNNTFDFEICFGVFDACYQETALREMIKTLNIGGRLLLTGKNTGYYEDDDKAIIAEENARLKQHPNYFTDVKYMIEQLKKNGCIIEKAFFFERRGDFADFKFKDNLPEKFYEYLLVIRKKQDLNIDKFEKFSHKYSKTYRTINESGESFE